MATMAQPRPQVTVGVDTHGDVHVAAALDGVGRLLGTMSVPSTAAGYRRLLQWASAFGEIAAMGIEGTGAYGAGLARHLAGCSIRVVEVDRPDRRTGEPRGSPTRSTPRPPLERCSPVRLEASPSPGTERWR